MHIRELAKKCHESSAALRQANEENCRLHSRAVRAEQVKDENEQLKSENSRLEGQAQRAATMLAAEREKNQHYEDDIDALYQKIDKLGF